MTIMTEVGDITRFEKVGHYSSYCRCVSARSTSNGKRKKDNNRKNGNRYLAWAYVEAANFHKRYCPQANKFVQRKTSKTNYSLAIKALGNKLSKASYFIMMIKSRLILQCCLGHSLNGAVTITWGW